MDPTMQRLMALSRFLIGRAQDRAAKKQISQRAFVDLAKNLGINITIDSLGDLLSKDPLKNVFEPLEPNSGVLRFRGNSERSTDTNPDKAKDIVDRNAKKAMRRGLKK